MDDAVYRILGNAYRVAYDAHERAMKRSEEAITAERTAHAYMKEIEVALVKLGFNTDKVLEDII